MSTADNDLAVIGGGELAILSMWREGRRTYIHVRNPHEVYEPAEGGYVGTYSPHLIYEVAPLQGIGLQLLADSTRRHNEAHYAGYFGPDYDESVRVFYPQGEGQPRLAE